MPTSPVICPMDSGSVPDSAVEYRLLQAPTTDTPQPLSLSHTAPISHTRPPPPGPQAAHHPHALAWTQQKTQRAHRTRRRLT